MHEESCCFQVKALQFAPARTCKALACPSRENRTLQTAKSCKLSRKSPDSAQTVLGFAGSWGWIQGFNEGRWGRGGGAQSNPESNHQADPRAKLSPRRPSPLPQPRPRESGDTRAGRLPGRASRQRLDGWIPEGPTYLSARSLSPTSPSAIPSRLSPTSRPMARNGAAARARPGSTVGGARVRLQGAGRAPPRPRPRRVPDSGPWRLRPRPAPGLCQPKAHLP